MKIVASLVLRAILNKGPAAVPAASVQSGTFIAKFCISFMQAAVDIFQGAFECQLQPSILAELWRPPGICQFCFERGPQPPQSGAHLKQQCSLHQHAREAGQVDSPRGCPCHARAARCGGQHYCQGATEVPHPESVWHARLLLG